MRGPEHPLFVSRRGRISKQVMVLLPKRVSRRIGRRLHPHLFRHTFATERLNRRLDLRVIQKLLATSRWRRSRSTRTCARSGSGLVGVSPGGH